MARRDKLKKRPTQLPEMTVAFTDGPLAGHEFVMHEPPSWMVFSDTEFRDRELVGPAIAAVVDSTLDIDDLTGIPPAWGLALARGWIARWKDLALDPTTGRLSVPDSPEEP